MFTNKTILFIKECYRLNDIYKSLTVDSDLTIFDKHVIDHCFNNSIKEDNPKMVEKLGKYLGHSDNDLWDLAIKHVAPNVLKEFLPKIEKPIIATLALGYSSFENFEKLVRLCLSNNIKLASKISTEYLMDRIIGFDDIDMCKHAIAIYPQFQTINYKNLYMLNPTEYSAEYFTPTFLTFAITNYSLNCLSIILNTCPVFDQFNIYYSSDCSHINDEISKKEKKLAKKYGFNSKDIQLLVFADRSRSFFDADAMTPEDLNETIAKANKMFDSILYVYTVRKNWYKLVKQTFSRLNGFYWSSNNHLSNNRIPYLIWLAKQKPKGLPKLLMYRCVYPYIY